MKEDLYSPLEERQVWNACGYVRLSREDGDKAESNSITGQKELIWDFLSRRPELRLCGMEVDDGFTGSNFDRPAFREMMDQVRAGKINCILVKDLSRFGRNYLEAGEYIEKIFPFLGVRFIAINDHYDSLWRDEEADGLMIPFKNLINEAYCRDASVKIRSQLEIKRRRGEFVGSFAVFGYRKDPENKNRLVIDDYAADIVRDIFDWKLDGISSGDIAGRLNEKGLPTPMEYKKSLGLRFSTVFRQKEETAWSAGMVLRILKNPVYAGTLIQGRVTTPSYKVRRVVRRPPREWAVAENAHEAVVSPLDFETVQRVLALDTRRSPKGQEVGVFSGLLYCGECGGGLIRKTVPSGKKKYVYYVCSARENRRTGRCGRLPEEVLKGAVLETLRQHIGAAMGERGLLDMAERAKNRRAGPRKLKARLGRKEEEIRRYEALRDSLCESLAGGLLDWQEYQGLKKDYARRLGEAKKQAKALREEMERYLEPEAAEEGEGLWELDRRLAVTLIERILVYRDRRIEIVYRFPDVFWRGLAQGAGERDSGKEAF